MGLEQLGTNPFEAPETVFRLLQFLALALPAVTIYLQVLTSLYTEPFFNPSEYKGGGVLPTIAAKRLDFIFGVVSLFLFVLAAMFLMGRLMISWSILKYGLVVLEVAMGVFLISLVFTGFHSLMKILGRDDGEENGTLSRVGE